MYWSSLLCPSVSSLLQLKEKYMSRLYVIVAAVLLTAGCESARWLPLVAEYDWPVHEVLAVMECESTGRPHAVNPTSGTAGLMQVHPGNMMRADAYYRPLRDIVQPGWSAAQRWLLVPENNLRAAYLMWEFSGWSQWECKP